MPPLSKCLCSFCIWGRWQEITLAPFLKRRKLEDIKVTTSSGYITTQRPSEGLNFQFSFKVSSESVDLIISLTQSNLFHCSVFIPVLGFSTWTHGDGASISAEIFPFVKMLPWELPSIGMAQRVPSRPLQIHPFPTATLCLSGILPSLSEEGLSTAYVYLVTENISHCSTNDPSCGTEPRERGSGDLLLVPRPLWEMFYRAALYKPPSAWKNKGLWEGVTCQVPRKVAYLQSVWGRQEAAVVMN